MKYFYNESQSSIVTQASKNDLFFYCVVETTEDTECYITASVAALREYYADIVESEVYTFDILAVDHNIDRLVITHKLLHDCRPLQMLSDTVYAYGQNVDFNEVAA